MKTPDLETRSYWAAVKAVHAARLDPHPGKRCEALGALRNYARSTTADPRHVEPLLTRLESRHGPHRRTDTYRMALWPDRRTVARYEAVHALTGQLPDLDILDQKG
jgi:hypothetical protein